MAVSRVRPCWHMRNLIPQLADGTLKGILLKYAIFHVHHCERCQHALSALKSVIQRIKRIRTPESDLPPEKWSAVEAAWDEAERRE